MDRSRVAVLYSHPLFGKGIAKLLSQDARLDVSCEPARDEDLASLVRGLLVDAVVLEGCIDPHGLSRLVEGLPPIPVAFVDLSGNALVSYRQGQQVVPPPTTILDAVLPAGL